MDDDQPLDQPVTYSVSQVNRATDEATQHTAGRDQTHHGSVINNHNTNVVVPPLAPQPAPGDSRFRRWLAVAVAVVAILVVGAVGIVLTNGNGDGANTPAADRAAKPTPEVYLSGAVNIGISAEKPRWSTYRNGKWSGFDVELAKWLADELNFTAVFVPISVEDRFDWLTNDTQKVKLVISTFAMDGRLPSGEARRTQLSFAGPYFIDVAGELRAQPSGPDCASAGSTAYSRAWAGGRDAVTGLQSRPSFHECLQDLIYQRADPPLATASNVMAILEADLNDSLGVAEYFAKESAKLSKAAQNDAEARRDWMRSLKPMAKTPTVVENYGVAFPKGIKGLCEYLNVEIGRFIELTDGWERKFDETLGWGDYKVPKHVTGTDGITRPRKPGKPGKAECDKNGD